MRQFVHVTVADLAAYRESPGDLAFDKAQALYMSKRWITGMGELTDAGRERLKSWDALGATTGLTRTMRDALRDYHKGECISRAALRKLSDHRLIKGDELTERGAALLELFAGEETVK